MSRFNEFLNDVKEFIKGFTPNAEVYLLSSYAEGRVVASSDIDILVIVDEEDRARAEGVKMGVKREYIDYPIKIHVITKEEFDRWYKRFVGNLIKV
jgi:predicted nucleotidyltransferase